NMPTGGVAHQADTIRIDAELGSLGAHKLDRSFHVVDGAGIESRFAESILDGERRIALLGQIRPPILVRSRTTVLPAATMARDHNGGLRHTLGRIEIARELDAVMDDVFDIGPGDDVMLGPHRSDGDDERRNERTRKSEHSGTPGCHETPPAALVWL